MNSENNYLPNCLQAPTQYCLQGNVFPLSPPSTPQQVRILIPDKLHHDKHQHPTCHNVVKSRHGSTELRAVKQLLRRTFIDRPWVCNLHVVTVEFGAMCKGDGAVWVPKQIRVQNHHHIYQHRYNYTKMMKCNSNKL